MTYRFDCVALGVTNEADRATLDPTRCIDTVDLLAIVTEHATTVVRNHAVLGVVRNLVELRAEVANRAVYGLNRNLAELTG